MTGSDRWRTATLVLIAALLVYLVVVPLCFLVYGSLVITLVSAFHYLIQVIRIGQSQAP